MISEIKISMPAVKTEEIKTIELIVSPESTHLYSIMNTIEGELAQVTVVKDD